MESPSTMHFRTLQSAQSLGRRWRPDVWDLESARSFIASTPSRHFRRAYECSRKFSETPATTHQTIPKRTITQRPRKKRGTNLREQRVGENGGVQTNPSSTWSRTLSHTKVRCTLARKFSRTRRQPPIQSRSNWQTTFRTQRNFATRMPVIMIAWQ